MRELPVAGEGINACRTIRVIEATDVSAWLTISRAGRDSASLAKAQTIINCGFETPILDIGF